MAHEPAAAFIAIGGLALLLAAGPVAAPAAEPPRIEVATGDGATVSGALAAIDAAGVRLADSPPGSGSVVTVPVDRIRAVRRTDAEPAGEPRRLAVQLLDGSTIDGDDVAWDGTGAVAILRPDGRIEVPAARVRSVAWRGADGAAAGWLDEVPEGTQSDLVVVGTAAGREFVECAITAVAADAVTVLLDEEKIPVKRSKVVGLLWLRAAAADGAGQGRLAVSLRGGRVRADAIAWSPEGLVLDGDVRLPADAFAGVDYAAGRRVSLSDITAERADVEPWFGSLAKGDGLAAYFAPRTIRPAAAGAGEPPTIVMRPRSRVVWRLPAESRRLRTVVAPHAGPQAADAAELVVAADDRELFRGRVDAAALSPAEPAAAGGAAGAGRSAGIPLDLDVTGARRLTVTIDFVAGGGLGGAVRFIDPVIER